MSKRLLVTGAVVVAAAVPSLALAAGTSMSPVVSSKLTGTAEVPKAGGGSGIVVFHLNAKTGRVCWAFSKVSGIGTPTAAHIHKAAAGKAGPVVVALGGAYKAGGCTKAPTKTVEAIESSPNAYYANIHTAKYPNGAIRGQLVAGMVNG